MIEPRRMREFSYTSIPDIPGSITSRSTRSGSSLKEQAPHPDRGGDYNGRKTFAPRQERQRIEHRAPLHPQQAEFFVIVTSVLYPVASVASAHELSADSRISGVEWSASASGRLSVNVEPSPKVESTVTMLPPCCAITCLTMLRPRPVPPVCREQAGSTH